MKLRHLLPGLDANTHPDIDMRPAMVTWFGDHDVLQRVKGPPMAEGLVLGLDVTYEFLAAVRRQRGLLVKPGVLMTDKYAVLSLLLLADDHVAACVADIADPEIARLAERCRADTRIPLLLSCGGQQVLSVCQLHGGDSDFFRGFTKALPVSVEGYTAAVIQQAVLLLDDEFLARQAIDASRIGARTVHLHLPPSCLVRGKKSARSRRRPDHH